MSAITDNKERQEGLDADKGKKVGPGVDFVDYFVAGTAVVRPEGQPEGDQAPSSDLCGRPAAVQRGTTYEKALAKDQSKKCTDAGKKAVKIQSFENDTEAQTRVKSGGAVAGRHDYPVAVDLARKAGNGNAFEVIGEQVDAGPFGIAVNKDNKELHRGSGGGRQRDHRGRHLQEDPREVGRRRRAPSTRPWSTAASDGPGHD
ncbi:hypothetical protein SALBM217S_04193 [Streptomyces griseoloalbus]